VAPLGPPGSSALAWSSPAPPHLWHAEWRLRLDAVFAFLDGGEGRVATQQRNKPPAAGPLTVSVIIPTRNREKDLDRCLRSIARQERLPSEVIVMDDGEVDVRPLGHIVEEVGIRFLYEKKSPDRRGPCSSRNAAIRLSSGDLLVFLDDDTELDPAYIASYAEILEADHDEKVGGLSGAQERYRGDGPQLRRRKPDWEERARRFFLLASARGGRVLASGFRSSLLSPGELEPVEFLQGGNMVLRRRVAFEFQFDESLDRFGGYALGDDVMFSYPVGRKYQLYATGKARLKHFRTPGGRPEPRAMNQMYVVHQWRFLREVMRGGLLNIALVCGLGSCSLWNPMRP
jgi:glycosyltransferase involved in cell wall biosynthesis